MVRGGDDEHDRDPRDGGDAGDPRVAMRESKRPRSALAGPYGRPLHPPLAGLAAGAWVCSLGFDLVSTQARDPGVYTRGAYWLVLAGIGFGLLAALTGLLDTVALPRGSRVFRDAVAHLALADVALVLFTASFLVRRFDLFVQTPWYLLVISLVALAALAAGSWSGLALTFTWGVRVADESDQARGFVVIDPEGSAPTIAPDAEGHGAEGHGADDDGAAGDGPRADATSS